MLYVLAILNYLWCVLTDGDYLNDWLTYLPHQVAAYLELVGRYIAAMIGG